MQLKIAYSVAYVEFEEVFFGRIGGLVGGFGVEQDKTVTLLRA